MIVGMTTLLTESKPRSATRHVLPARAPTLSGIKLLDVPAWSSAGPAPIAIGGTSSFSGAIEAITAQKIASNPDTYLLYVATVNGGVWRCDAFIPALLRPGGQPPSIQWTPIGDAAATLATGCVAIDPNDPSGNTLWAGTGQFSSSGGGGLAVGLLCTANARDIEPTWVPLGGSAQQPGDVSLAFQRIARVLPTQVNDPTTHLQVILVAAVDGAGIVRSADGGTSFQQVQGPNGALSGFGCDLIADPNDPQTFYAALGATFDNAQNLVTRGGVFRSTDTGRTWKEIDNGIPQASRSKSLKLAIFNNAGGSVPAAGLTVLYVGESDTSGKDNNLIGIFRAADPRVDEPQWTALYSDPDPTHIPNGLNAMQWPAAALVPWFAFAVDPGNWDNLYLGGMSWLYRVQVLGQPGAVGTQWTQWDTGVAFDHRSLTFLAPDILLGTGDQGVFGLGQPADGQQWVSLNNSIAVTEFYAIAFDPTLGVLIGGAQDVGSEVENQGTTVWGQLPNDGGDGGLTLVGADGTYYYETNGAFRRDTNGNAVQPNAIPSVTGTHGAALNPVNPMQLLWAGSAVGGKLSESDTQGDSVRDITPADMTGNVTAMAYGSDNPSAAFVGTSTGQLFLRTAGNGAPVSLANYPGGDSAVNDIAVDRTNWRRAVVISADGRLLFTPDGGTTWTNLRGNVGDMLLFMRKIEIVNVGGIIVVLIAGDPPAGNSGVVRTVIPDPFQPPPNVVWTPFGTGLPHVNVFDLHYCPATRLRDRSLGGDLLIAGTLGRGAWLVDSVTGDAIFFTGSVMDANGNPVVGATVRISETDAGVPGIITTTTDATGAYSATFFPGLYDGRYTIDVFGPGVQPIEITISPIPPGVTTVTHNFTLNRIGVLSGSVTDTHGAPISGSLVMVGSGIPTVGLPNTFIVSTHTDANGNYSTIVDPPGVYNAVAAADGFEDSDPAPITISLDTSTTQNFALVASQPGTVTGFVTNADTGDPIARAVVEAEVNPSNKSVVTMTDDNGAYTLALVPSGRRPVTARTVGRGFATSSQIVRVVAGQTVEADFVLNPKPSRRGSRK
jgi:hypothetical protein